MAESARAHAALLLLGLLFLFSACSPGVTQASSALWVRAAPTHLPLGPMAGLSTPPSPVYDVQIGITYGQAFAAIAYNVTAVAQTDADGYGPAYLLNGLTESGYWYQIGVSYDWPYSSGGYQPGFAINFEVFDGAQNSIYPASGGGGLENFTGAVNSGDSVLLSLSFSGGNVVMSVKDWNTGANGQASYRSFGTKFIGLSTSSDPNGYFTGLMTEWYHVSSSFGQEGEVTYSAPSPKASAVMWADEFNSNTNASVFGNSASVAFTNPTQLQPFSSNGATSFADAYKFITGALGSASFTLGFSVVGGGSGYSAPILTYTLGGSVQTATLTRSLATYYADQGTAWQVSSSLPGGSADERWQANQQTSGTAGVALSATLVYYHQFLRTFDFAVFGGGSGYSPPTIQAVQFGAPITLASQSAAWVDAGTSYYYPSALQGSSSTERWAAAAPSGTVGAGGTTTVAYQHQYALALQFVVTGGGSPSAPVLTGTQGGAGFSSPVVNSTTYFLDAGTPWSVPATLAGSTPQERWVATQGAGGTVSGAESVSVVYRHQYALTSENIPSSGGTTSVASAWEDAGSTVRMTQAASPGWQFEFWNGTGTGSYSGSAASATVTVRSPISETASFYPGLTIIAGNDGAVLYSFGTSSGTVVPGTSLTVFAPSGTTVTLEASPSSFLYGFSGWAEGASGMQVTAVAVLTTPGVVQANFSLSLTVIGGAAAVAVVAAAAVLFMRSRRRTTSEHAGR
ncbi:MAG: hypothetical protein JRM80_00165 [Nitrososphaerota archaeon]|nr:hypothetical protein [Nitrososphaerota archaeon]